MFDGIFLRLCLIWLGVISLVSVAVCVWDKRVSRINGHRRIPERTLILLSLLGGSVFMYLTMLLVRHKTKHPKFMVGIPLIIVLQVAAITVAKNMHLF